MGNFKISSMFLENRMKEYQNRIKTSVEYLKMVTEVTQKRYS